MRHSLLLLLFLQCSLLLKAQNEQKFIIGVYNSPSADEREFRNLKDGRFNTIYAANPRGMNPWKPCEGEQDVDTYRGKVINMAKEEGLEVLLDGSWAEQSSAGFMVSTYNKMEAFSGCLLPPVLGNTRAEGWSLPYAMRYDRVLSTKYKKKGRYISILPNYADRSALGDFETDDAANYQAYLSLINDKLKPQAMTLTHYPMTLGSGEAGTYATDIEKDGFLENLEAVAEFSKAESVPFWANIMGTAHNDRKYAPTFSMYRMMAHAALAYGAEGLFYYTYSRPCGENELDESFYGPFVGATYLYDKAYWFAIKKMNRALEYMGPHLLKADWQYTERWTDVKEHHKVCLDSCELLRIPEYDTSYVKMDTIPQLHGFLVKEGYDSCWIASSKEYWSDLDSNTLYRLKMIMAADYLEELASDSIMLDSSSLDRMIRAKVNLDSLDQHALDSLQQIYLPAHYILEVVSQRIKEVDVSKNIHMDLEGEDLDVLFSVFDYGEENKMIILTNYNYDKEKEATVKFDFGEYFKALELTPASQNFSKRFQKHESKIEAGDIRVFILKKVNQEED
jgi:hypothetical protein